MMRRLLVPALLVLFAVPSCATRDANRAAAPPVSVTDASSHAAAARELLAATRSREAMERSQAQALPMIMRTIEAMGVPADDRSRFERCFRVAKDFMDEQMSWERVEPELVQAYMNVYSEAELRELTGFYASPIGQKTVERQPLVEAEAFRIMQTLVADSQPRLMEMIRAEVEAEVHGEPQTPDWAAGDTPPAVAWPPGVH